jgi:hypothetical protein
MCNSNLLLNIYNLSPNSLLQYEVSRLHSNVYFIIYLSSKVSKFETKIRLARARVIIISHNMMEYGLLGNWSLFI